MQSTYHLQLLTLQKIRGQKQRRKSELFIKLPINFISTSISRKFSWFTPSGATRKFCKVLNCIVTPRSWAFHELVLWKSVLHSVASRNIRSLRQLLRSRRDHARTISDIIAPDWSCMHWNESFLLNPLETTKKKLNHISIGRVIWFSELLLGTI